MKKIIIATVLFVSSVFSATWKNEAIASLNVTQNSNHNWAAGGEDALSWQVSVNAASEGSFTLWDWKNHLQLAYGRTRIDDEASRKHLDKIFFESLLNYNLLPTIKPYASGRVESQFTKSYSYSDTSARVAISDFWNPGYLTESVGMSWSPRAVFQTRLGFAVKQTYSADYGWADDIKTTAEQESFRNEPGLESITEINYALNDILKYQGRLSAFVNFKGVNEIDGHWENTLNAQVAKYLVFSAGLEMLYDKDLSLNSQLRQSVNVGLTYQML